MTSEEAIKQLKEFIILHREQHGWDVSTIKALEMAIKALEREPCEDCVKIEKAYELGYEDCRADVLEIIDKYRSKSEE